MPDSNELNLLNLNLNPKPEPILTAEEQQALQQDSEFVTALASTKVLVTPTLIGMNVVVFALMALNGVSLFEPTVAGLIKWGADFGPLTMHGEWWRVVTACFVHIGLIHIALNMLVLANIGAFTERLFGNVGFTVVYLLSGIGGSLTSLAIKPFSVSAGASGAVFGLYGALLGYLLRQRDSVPREKISALAKGALMFVGYNVVYGASRAGIDMAAHFGGLATGFLIGMAIAQPVTVTSVASRLRLPLVVGVCGLLIAAVVFARMPAAEDLTPEFERAIATESKVVDIFNASLTKWKADQMSGPVFADVIEKDMLPPWNAERASLEKLKHLEPGQERQARILLEYMTTRGQAWSLMAEGLRSNDQAKLKQVGEILAQADRMAAQMEAPAK